jgi:phage baseplate assembly protein gpV
MTFGEQKEKQLGRVVSVTQSSNGMVQCSVQLPHAGGSVSNVPVGKPHSGVMWKPKPGWAVVVDYLDDGNPYIADVLSVPSKDYSAPDLAEGSMTFRFDDSTAITVDKDGNGNYTVDIEASGKVSVSAADAVEVDGSTIDLDADGTASAVNLGPNGDAVVTDVSTTTDSDGHVTGISLTKTSKTKAE